MIETKEVRPKHIRNRTHKLLGLVLLLLNKIRYSLRGYKNPRPFPVSEIKKTIDYDMSVVKGWLDALDEYKGSRSIRGKNILELGPGADFGVALALLSNGAKTYHAMDVNDLIHSPSRKFYRSMIKVLEKVGGKKVDGRVLREELKKALNYDVGRINFELSKSFDLSVFKDKKIDLVFSQAAFEHFDDVEKTIKQLSEISGKGTVLIAEVDLITHTRKLRENDPLNIYRHPDLVYNFLKFSGSPNRLRPYEYEKFLKKHGWKNVKIKPLQILPKEYLDKVSPTLAKRFQAPKNKMSILTMLVMAEKK